MLPRVWHAAGYIGLKISSKLCLLFRPNDTNAAASLHEKRAPLRGLITRASGHQCLASNPGSSSPTKQPVSKVDHGYHLRLNTELKAVSTTGGMGLSLSLQAYKDPS